MAAEQQPQEFDVEAATAKQKAVVAELVEAGGAEVTALRRECSYLVCLLQLPELRAKLQRSTDAEDWTACIELQTKIQTLENGHTGWAVSVCDDTCHHQYACTCGSGSHLPCCGLKDPKLRCTRFLLARGDAVQLLEDVCDCPAGAQGVVLSLVPNDGLYQVLLPHEESGLVHSVKTTQVAPCQFRNKTTHSAGYRMFSQPQPLLLFAEEKLPISRWCGTGDCAGGACAHTAPAMGTSHWMCCGQPSLFAQCAQAFTHGLGDVVTIDGVLGVGVVTAVDLGRPDLNYFVSCVDDATSQWTHESKLKLVDAEGLPPPPQVHTGEFRAVGSRGVAAKVLYGPGPARRLSRKCSLPDSNEEDGLACTHAYVDEKGAAQPVHVVSESHWSCCGLGLFAPECRAVPKPPKPQEDPDRDDLVKMMARLVLLKALCS